jgi:hypothetical protein
MMLSAAGCGADGTMNGGGEDLAMAPEPDLAVPPDFAIGPDLAVPPGYPAGPYGFTVGKTVPNLTFNGYFAPTQLQPTLASSQPFGLVTFDQARTTPGGLYMLVMFAGFT